MIGKSLSLLGAGLLALSLFATLALSQTPEEKGRQIMRGVFELPQMEKIRNEAELRIYDKQGNLLFTKRLRGMIFYKDFRKPEVRLRRSINYFFAPADDKGNGSLAIEFPDSDDDEQYLYLKQTRKVRRIIGSSKKDDFFGSDFSLGDITRRRFHDYNFKWLGEDTVEFKGKRLTVQKIESTFKSPQKSEEWGEGKSVLYVHPQSGIVFKAERYNLQLQLSKVSSILAFGKRKNRDGKPVYLVARIEMRNVVRGTRSEFIIKNAQYEDEAKFDPSMFVTDSLTKKWW